MAGLPSTAAIGSLLAATLGVAITSVVTGQLTSVLGLVAQALIPDVPKSRRWRGRDRRV